MSLILFDFNDGNGPVPARRHTNPDESKGGWVAETAEVSATAYVGKNARVYGNAHVYGYSQICGDTKLEKTE